MPLALQAGTLRHRIDIEAPAVSIRPASGAVPKAWVPFAANLAAAVQPLAGREVFAAEGLNAQATFKITLRYQPGITQKMRVKFGARTFDIVSVANVEERNRVTELNCREGRSQGN